MSEYTTEGYAEHIRRMSDAALLRLKAINGGELESMRIGDEYFSTITSRSSNSAYQDVNFEDVTQAFVGDKVGDALLQQDQPAAPLLGMLSGMVLSLADAHDLSQSRHITPLGFDETHATKLIEEAWLLSTSSREHREAFKLYSLDLAHTAITSILLSPSENPELWRLGYESRTSKVTYWANPDLDLDIEEDDGVELSITL